MKEWGKFVKRVMKPPREMRYDLDVGRKEEDADLPDSSLDAQLAPWAGPAPETPRPDLAGL
jgi:hypothetical protein